MDEITVLKGIYNTEAMIHQGLPKFDPEIEDGKPVLCLLCWHQPKTMELLRQHYKSHPHQSQYSSQKGTKE